jgi:phenylpropionate dioxygenase-like ring-hydroxylating dioxygenase large terminal subunit
LSQGCIVEDQIECPFHGFLYDEKGTVTRIPANGKHTKVPQRFYVHGYKTKEAYGFIWVWYGKQEEAPDTSIPFFEDIKIGYNYSTFKEQWNVHYTRAAENQLDVVHLPFVHKTTIGKGHKTLVNGPVVKWKGQLMEFYVHNVLDDGHTIPKKPEEIEDYEKLFKLQFLMPHLWQNIISDEVRIFAAFVPIDNENTMIYLRFYQKFMGVPVLRRVLGWISNYFNKIILHQDRHVVLTQLPKKTALKMGENLIQGDLPIIEYRKKRDELIRLVIENE